MATIHVKFFGIALLSASLGAFLGGCVSSGNYHVENATSPLPRHVMADEVFVDGTGPSARRLAGTRQATVERYPAGPQLAGAPTRAVVRTRPTAIEPTRADNISASTTGTRNSVRGDSNKPFSDQWWEKERREDDRLRAKMNICRGC